MNKDELNIFWKNCLDTLKISVSPAIYSTWFSKTHITKVQDSKNRSIVEIGCPSSYVKTTVEKRYYGLIQDTISKALNKPVDLIFIIKQINNNLNPNNNEKDTPLFSENIFSKQDFEHILKKTHIRATFTFENYAVSSTNQMAWAAADAVSKEPGHSYNPLFIWGGVGVGKTHLMNAVGFFIIKKNPEAKLLFCTGEQFTNDIVEGIRNKTTQKFREKYRKLDALFVDDIQFIAGKDAVQEEFFHTFNALITNGGQVILTSDKPPTEIAKLEERLKSRFEAGLIVDIAPPDFELRCAITQIKAEEKGIKIPMDLVQIIAGNIETPRQIEGYLIRLYQEVAFKKESISENLVKKLLGKNENTDRIIKAKPQDVIKAIVNYYNVGKRSLLGPSRVKTIALPRQILMYLLRTYLNLPLQEIGRIVGGRDHTTVMHAVDKISTFASENVQIREDLRGIKNLLWG